MTVSQGSSVVTKKRCVAVQIERSTHIRGAPNKLVRGDVFKRFTGDPRRVVGRADLSFHDVALERPAILGKLLGKNSRRISARDGER
jgi:hypothetical protein